MDYIIMAIPLWIWFGFALVGLIAVGCTVFRLLMWAVKPQKERMYDDTP